MNQSPGQGGPPPRYGGYPQPSYGQPQQQQYGQPQQGALEGLDFASAIFRGAQGLGIGIFCGLGGMYRGAQQKAHQTVV